MTSIVLVALNAKYLHTAFGLRCLLANLGPLRSQAVLREFTIHDDAAQIVETILAERPQIVGLSVFVWNVALAEQVCALLAQVAPEVVVVLGGPEVSYEIEAQAITGLARYVIPGEGEGAFARLAAAVLEGRPPEPGVLPQELPDLAQLRLPYGEYEAEDIAQRIIYVEASRGCPYRCEFCLSSLDKQVRTFPLPEFLAAMAELHERGVRHFKFVDRTFNLDLRRSIAVMEFFAARACPELLLHFEMIPDRLPQRLREAILALPPGCLHFEVGVQTLDEAVAARIDRRQDPGVIEDNLRWLSDATRCHVHADLIVGLPGESIEGFGLGFDRLYGTGVAEIQVGILKRLRGAPIARHDQDFGMRYAAHPPYQVLQTSCVSFAELQEMGRFARFWDLLANSGHYAVTLPRLYEALDGASMFNFFRGLAAELFVEFGRTHAINPRKLAATVYQFGVGKGVAPARLGAWLVEDHLRSGRLQLPEFLRPYLSKDQRLAISRQRGNPAARRQQARASAQDAM